MNRWCRRMFTMVAASSILAACGGQATPAAGDSGGVVQNDDGKQDAIGGFEAPETLVPGASRRLASNIVGADVGKTFGTDDAHVPYPDTYWPFTDEGVDAAWNGGDSPLEKLMKLADASNLKAAKDWEHNNHGNGVPGVGGWWGHCPGWTGAAMANAPITHAAWAKADGNGGLAACTAGAAGCTKFEIGDINALMAEIYVDGDSSFIGARCDTAATSVKRDANGRITTPGCGGVNPGTLLIVAAARMKKQHLPFAIDAQNDYNTDQIWNQPAYRYTVNRYPVADGRRGGEPGRARHHDRRRHQLPVQPGGQSVRARRPDAALGVGARAEQRAGLGPGVVARDAHGGGPGAR